MKARIVADNLAAGVIRHVDVVDTGAEIGSADDLRFGPPWRVDDSNVASGVGFRRVVVEVYDMAYDFEEQVQTNRAAIMSNLDFFPPAFLMEGTGGGGGGGGAGLGSLGGSVEGGATSAGAGTGSGGGGSGPGNLTLDNYGAYLVRAMLFDSPAAGARPIRVAEEAFVQVILP
jgi:hypothetical protein